VPDADIQHALAEPDPDAALDRLVQLALDAGAPDNVTCVIADIVDDGDAPELRSGSGEHPSYLLGAAREFADDRAARNTAG
jgi:protein phosphatase